MKHIKHIFFDLDHTLWDFDKNSALAFEIIFKEKFPQINIKDFIKVYMPINQECWRLYQLDQISHEELRYNRLKHSFDAINTSISNLEIDFVSDRYLELLPEHNHLFDGAIEVLNYLNSKYDLHIVTNGFANVQDRKMKNSGLNPFFQTITNSENAGAKKPHFKIFETALNAAKATKENSIMIGDSWDADVMGAINFGINAIYFNPDKLPFDKNAISSKTNQFSEIHSLIEIKTLF